MSQGLPQVAEHKVVVLSITYNQAEYIEDTLNGFVAQHTDFPFLCCVFDDASTDGEKDVLRHWIHSHCNAEEVEEYDHPLTSILMGADKVNPNCIYVFHLLKVNSYGKPGKAELLKYWRNHGKYVAMCEGDDYWTDPLKLQKQVDFLESHPDYSLCTHHFRVYHQDLQEYESDWYAYKDVDYEFNLSYFVSRKAWVTQPLTILYRNLPKISEEYEHYKLRKDITLIYLLLKHGKGMLLKDVMGVYRLHGGGVWIGIKNEQRINAEIKYTLAIYDVERNQESAKFVRNSIYGFGYIGYKYLWRHYKLYSKAIRVVLNELGLKVTMKTIFRSFNIFHKYFGY